MAGPFARCPAVSARHHGSEYRRDVSGFGGDVYCGAHGGPDILYKFDRFLARIQKLLDNNGGDIKVVGEAFLPHIKGIAGALMNFDTGQILSNMLASLPEDGAITLHVTIPPS